jgi:membrane-bound lytic murein transglycosylase B
MPMTPRLQLSPPRFSSLFSAFFRSVVAGCLLMALSTAPAAAKGAGKKAAVSAKNTGADDAAGEFANFSQWKEVGSFIDEMSRRHGFDKAALTATFNQVRYVAATIDAIKPAPPGRPKNWHAYSRRFIEPQRIAAGVAFWNQYAGALAQAEERYGVPADIIVGIMGVETFYGRNTGNFRVMDALTTLAFAYPNTANRDARMAFFRTELENLLLFARESRLDPFDLRGSYAGAIGWPQFMPSSIRQFAVDFDNDGQIDLRNSAVDAIGSIANFLVQHGWQRNAPLVYPASMLSSDNTSTWKSLIGRGVMPELRRDNLIRFGLVSTTEIPADLPLGLIDLQNGMEPTEYWVGGNNFFSITQYNRSYFYAMSVVDLGHAVKAQRQAP